MDTDHGQVQAPCVPPQQVASQSNGLAIAALVLGIVSFIPVFPLGLLTAPVGLILGIVALRKRRPGQGMAVAGVIVSAVMLVFWLVAGSQILRGLMSMSRGFSSLGW